MSDDISEAVRSAARAANSEEMLRAIDAGGNVNAKDSYGETAAMWAAAQGHLHCLKDAVAAGCDINAKDDGGETAAMWAAENGHRDCLEYAVNAGGDINAKDNWEKTAVILAAENGHIGCLEYAVTAGGHVNARDERGMTAAMWAAWNGNIGCLRYVLDAGADVNAEDEGGRTAVLYAAMQGHHRCLEVAIGAGGSINAIDVYGRTAVMYAAVENDRDCVECAVAAGAYIQCRDSEGHTAAQLAADVDITEWLEEIASARDKAAADSLHHVAKLERELATREAAIGQLQTELDNALSRVRDVEAAREADVARLQGELEGAKLRMRAAEAAATADWGSLPGFLQRAVSSIGEYMAGGGLAAAGLAARRGLVGSLRLAAAEEAVRVAAAEWCESKGEGSMRAVAESVAVRDAAVASEVGMMDTSALARAQLEELQIVFNQSKQLMKQCVARRLAVAAADEAVEKARPLLGRLRRARLRGEAVEEAAVTAAETSVAGAETELREAQGALERVLQAMREVLGVCPEVQCKLSWRASVDDGLEAVTELGDVAEAALLSSISERVERLQNGDRKVDMGNGEESKALVEWQYESENGKWLAYSEEEGCAMEAEWLGRRQAVSLEGGRVVMLAGDAGAVEVRGTGNGDGGRRLAVRRLVK